MTTEHRSGDYRRTGEDGDGQPDPEFTTPERALDEQRHDRQQHPDVDEEDERRRRDDQERRGQQAHLRRTVRVRRRRHLVNPAEPHRGSRNRILRATDVTRQPSTFVAQFG
jgi:hypothetical protein